MLMKTIAIPNRESSCDVNPERWVDDHRDRLFRYALLRVRRPEVATWRSWPALRRHTSTGKASPLTAVGSPDLTVVADAKPELIATQDKPAHRAMCWLMPRGGNKSDDARSLCVPAAAVCRCCFRGLNRFNSTRDPIPCGKL